MKKPLPIIHPYGSISGVIHSWLLHTMGNTETVPYLLERGAQLDLTLRADTTALGFAALKGHNDMVLLLLEKGTDIDGGPYVKFEHYACLETPLELAAELCSRIKETEKRPFL